MSIHVIIDGGWDATDGGMAWDFTDDEYEKALAMFNSLVYEDRDKGLLLRDGKRNDEVWLEKFSGRLTAWQKIKTAVLLKLQRSCRDGSRFGNERWPGRGTKPPAS